MSTRDNDDTNRRAPLPSHLKRWPGLYVRAGGRIVEAPAEDIELAQTYPEWPDKGAVVEGKRLTILTNVRPYRINEEVRIIHVLEVVDPGHQVYIMGPKPVYGEYINNRLATAPPPEGDPLVPLEYNGTTLTSPAVDYNYEIASYVFPEPGIYRIVWELQRLQSNILIIKVEEARPTSPSGR